MHNAVPPGDAPPPARAWWCNADFDLTLAHGGGKMPAKILQAARAMAWPLWPALAPGDALLVPEAPPEGFRESLREAGLTPPRFVVMPPESVGSSGGLSLPPEAAGSRFTPFGWNAAAAALNATAARRAAHPPLDVVRRVNSRAFGLELEKALCGDEACAATWCPGEKAVRAWLDEAVPGRYVAKGNHGSAGVGQFRFEVTPARSASPVSSRTAAALTRLAARHGGVVIEEELAVDREWGVLFHVGRDGRRRAARRHRLLSAPEGGYAGALVLPAREAAAETAFAPHRARALSVADGVARALHAEGYFGPVGLDMFTHRARGGAVRFRPLVDLNARQSMAWPAHGLATRFPDRAILFRQISATARLRDGRSVSNHVISDKLFFDLTARRGAIRLTPLLPFARVSWAIFGDDEADVLAQHDTLFARMDA